MFLGSLQGLRTTAAKILGSASTKETPDNERTKELNETWDEHREIFFDISRNFLNIGGLELWQGFKSKIRIETESLDTKTWG